MNRRRMFLLAIVCGASINLNAQEKIFTVKAVDNQNNSYNLSDCTISGRTVFHCRLKDTVFTLSFERVRSMTVNNKAASPYTGYAPATFVMADGGTAQAYIDLNNYWLEGTEVSFNIKIKIKLADITKLDLTVSMVPPFPSTTQSPPPLPAPAAPTETINQISSALFHLAYWL